MPPRGGDIMHKRKNVSHSVAGSDSKSYSYILKLISVPAIVAILFFVVTITFNVTKSIKENKREAMDVLSTSCSACEASLNSAITMTSFFANNNTVAAAFTDTNWEYRDEIADALKNFTETLPYIDSSYIYNIKKGIVYSESGEFKDNNFFTNVYSYNNYSASDLKSLSFYHSEPYRILSPTLSKVDGSDNTKSIIPIVVRRINNMKLNNYLIINVDIAEILHLPSNDAVETFIYNKTTNEIFYPDKYASTEKINNEQFLFELSVHPNAVFNFKFGNESTVVSTFSENDSIVGYTYFSIISIEKLIKKELLNMLIYLIAIALMVLSVVCIVLKNTDRIYIPIKRVETLLNKMVVREHSDSSNIFENVVSLTETVQHTNMNVFSFAQERYLINMLNSNSYYINEEQLKQFNTLFRFPYKYFAVVLIQIAPTTKFYDLYCHETYLDTRIDFYDIIKDMFSQHLSTYVLPAENDVLDIILNFDDESEYEKISVILRDIYKIMDNDREYLNLSVGVGGVCNNIQNLKKSHDDARHNFAVHEQPNTVAEIITFERNKCTLTRSEEDAVYIALSSYDKAKIQKAVSSLIESNNQSSHSIKLMYSYIIGIILKFIRVNNIPYKNEALDYEIINSLLKQPINMVSENVDELIDIIVQHKKADNNADEVTAAVMQHMVDNYTQPDISIKGVSSLFYISESSVSRIIKEQTGLGFRDYINSKRIEKAKELLIQSDKPIEEIYIECGFTNRQTFLRVFKANVGQTPSSYKNAHSNV